MFSKLVLFSLIIGIIYVHGQESQASGNKPSTRPPSPGRRPPGNECRPGESFRDGKCQKSEVRQKRSDEDPNSGNRELNPSIYIGDIPYYGREDIKSVESPKCRPSEILTPDGKCYKYGRHKRSVNSTGINAPLAY